LPVSAPSSSSRFRGRTAIAVSTPLNVSERRRVDEKEAWTCMAVWTPIRLAVVPDISSEPYPDRQCTGSVGPLSRRIYTIFMRYGYFCVVSHRHILHQHTGLCSILLIGPLNMPCCLYLLLIP